MSMEAAEALPPMGSPTEEVHPNTLSGDAMHASALEVPLDALQSSEVAQVHRGTSSTNPPVGLRMYAGQGRATGRLVLWR